MRRTLYETTAWSRKTPRQPWKGRFEVKTNEACLSPNELISKELIRGSSCEGKVADLADRNQLVAAPTPGYLS